MKKIFIICFLVLLSWSLTFGQKTTDIWEYDTDGDQRSTWSSGVFTLQTTAADTQQSAIFGPGPIFPWPEWNGLLGMALQVDSIAGANYVTPDTFWFDLAGVRGAYNTTRPGKILWQNAEDSTETDTIIIIPADHGKKWQWQSNPAGNYWDKWPDSQYYTNLYNLHADSATFRQTFKIY